MQNIRIWRHRPETEPAARLPLNVRSAGWLRAPRPWWHGEGTMDRINVYWGIAGCMRCAVDAQEYALLPEQLLLFPAGSLMGAAGAGSTGEYRWLTLDGLQAAPFLQGLGFTWFTPYSVGPCPRRLHDRLLGLLTEALPQGFYEAEHVAYELLMHAARSHRFPLGAVDGLVDGAVALIDSEFADPYLNINAIADRLRISRTTLTRHFIGSLGVPPSTYLEQQRLRHGARLLEAGATVHAAARDCGYPDPRYFSRLFRLRFGIPPGKWRQSHTQWT